MVLSAGRLNQNFKAVGCLKTLERGRCGYHAITPARVITHLYSKSVNHLRLKSYSKCLMLQSENKKKWLEHSSSAGL